MNDIVAPSAGQIGRSLQRIEARAKVTGRAEYIHNLRLPGMLHTKTCCSTIPHGHIRHIDGAAAEAIAGVHRVVTGKDIHAVIPDPYFGGPFATSRSWRSARCAMSALLKKQGFAPELLVTDK
jgi:CO/xanthine dehydrogenase Mo-binding subunit